MLGIPSVFGLLNTGVQIIVSDFHVVHVQLNHRFHIGSICHHFAHSLPGLSYWWHRNLTDGFQCGSMRWLPHSRSYLNHWMMVWTWIRSLQWIPCLFLTNIPTIFVLCQIHTFIKCIPQNNWQPQPSNYVFNPQFVYHCWCHGDKCLSTAHVICHQRSWHIWITNPFLHNNLYCPALVCKKVHSNQAGKSILIANNLVIHRLVNCMATNQPNRVYKTHMSRCVLDCIGKCAECWTGIV